MRALLFLLLAYWVLKAADIIFGLCFRMPKLFDEPVDAPLRWPRVSIIFAARDEAPRVGPALATMLSQDYPDLEVIAVDDRSTDGTGRTIAGARDPRLKILTVSELPQGWIGKNHALQKGYEASSGEWLLFTDADVHLDPQTLKRAIASAERRGLDHLTVFCELITRGYLEEVFTGYFALVFNSRYRPWAAQDRRSRAYVGIGAFNLVRRRVYEAAGTHRALALDIIDDMTLGRRIKRAGFRQMAMFGNGLVRVRWVEGVRGVLNALHKNGFRGLNYNCFFLIGATVALLTVDGSPWLALFYPDPAVRALGACCIATLFLIYASGRRWSRSAIRVFPAHPFASLFMIFILWRSAWSAWREGGVRWRETFYPIAELRRGMQEPPGAA